MGNGVKGPQQLAAAGIEAAHISRWRLAQIGLVRDRGTHDDHVPAHGGGRGNGVVYGCRGSAGSGYADYQVDAAVVAEFRHRFSTAGIHSDQKGVAGPHD